MNTVIKEIQQDKFVSKKKRNYVTHYLVTYVYGTKKYYFERPDFLIRFLKVAKSVYSTTWKGRFITIWRLPKSVHRL